MFNLCTLYVIILYVHVHTYILSTTAAQHVDNIQSDLTYPQDEIANKVRELDQ